MSQPLSGGDIKNQYKWNITEKPKSRQGGSALFTKLALNTHKPIKSRRCGSTIMYNLIVYMFCLW
jgi:hypothetical protein